ncbi:MAG: adenylyltransferase/cytidyltransferase family protein [Planctomycetota bacterium]|nr:adenylyltransferase/cytidyltransferase family protein [Planctomycetota bacterium]
MSVAKEQAVVEALAEARASGRRIVFTNGAFDLLHVGHLSVLEGAAALGDVLVVGVNDDASVRRLRGRGRPVVPARERAALIAALHCVDHVLVFSDDTVDRLLERLRPHVHAKGRDYREANLPERATNERLGIAMAFVGGPKDHSATGLLARAAAAATAAGGLDRVRPLEHPGLRGMVLDRALPRLIEHGWLDLARLVSMQEGELVEGTARRWVRRVSIGDAAAYVKVCRPASRRRDPRVEFENHVALRAAGFRAPEPWLAALGPNEGASASVLVTREVPGQRLDHWLRDHLDELSPGQRLDIATGIGQTIRALHSARFLFPDLQAWHLLVDASMSSGAGSIAFIDLMRLERARRRVGPQAAAPGLAALALSLRPYTSARFRLAIVRAYLGGTLRGGRAHLEAIARRIEKIKRRGRFRHLGDDA